MINQKQLWEKLAKENSKYYINSDKGRGITDEDFRESGKTAYGRLITGDELLKNRGTILDYGCGTGRLMEFMANDFNKVIGVDISATMVAEGKQRLRELTNVEFMETDGQYIPLPDKSIDIVFSYLVFQHIKERGMVEQTFKEIFRVLAPGGIFKVLLRSDKQKDMNRWWSGVEYSKDSIRALYEPMGFRLLKAESVDRYAFWLWLQK
ncbi:hypothetical protein A3E46_02280 [Candidatus Woesebacteria bacterium RIFCSPHIGHO2_12_FULL_46_16]|uniref:Methyltransferase type 11 domain-containing protein n=1 Tax=Candidatus Woesebacteria bacterium RIFCSPHIGHO2_12_FULL_46_16 TaxID=1802513 RepID=A0A1F8AXE0_9BACT|nr:MAG: hypothetical protein A3E46_02280 [Candidatus Woesebacteria bacterium RIFCSPHIGHO2_12_FULL_46_16]